MPLIILVSKTISKKDGTNSTKKAKPTAVVIKTLKLSQRQKFCYLS